MLLLCPLIRRVSHWTKPPSSSRNVVLFLCQPVLALDDEVRTLQQDLRTQPSLQRRRFSCVALCAHRGFPLQHTEAVLVGLALRRPFTTGTVIVSIWNRAGFDR